VDACTVDPRAPDHLYAFIMTSTSAEAHGLTLYETRNGGGSWHPLHTWPTAVRIMEIHPTSGGLYVVDDQDSGGGEGVYRSADGGATWRKLPLKDAKLIPYFGPTGRILATAYPSLYQVNPITGESVLLGDVTVTLESNGDRDVGGGVISAVAICEGSQPSLVVSGPYGTYVRSLPPLH